MKGNKKMDGQNHIQNLKIPFLLLGLSIMLSALIFGSFFIKAGVFQIIEPYSTEVESYGMYNTSSRKKDITVTVHAQFLIE